jgi:heptosyltransferase-2
VEESNLAADEPYVAIHPGSGGTRKSWPVSRFAELGRFLAAAGRQPVYLCGPIEGERPDILAALADSKVITPDLHDLTTVLRGAQLFIGNDSGPGHLAAAVGTRTLSLFGPTDAAVWRPLGEGCEAVEAPDGELSQLSVETVLDRALEMLGNR